MEKKKWKFTILGISIWRILAYFILYSIIGYIIEVAFGAITKGVIESRQSFLYGPFCGIYGLGAVIMIIFLQYFSKNNHTLFIGGFIIGSIVEYLVSLIGELILNVKWWDYSDMPLNIGGRICFAFSVFWGLLGVYLMKVVNPRVDKVIEKIKNKINIKLLKTLTVTCVVFLFIECILTGYALSLFLIRMIVINDIDVNDKEIVQQIYDRVYGDEEKADWIYKYWGDEKMIKTFPNLKLEQSNGEILFINTLLPDIQPYYFKFYER